MTIWLIADFTTKVKKSTYIDNTLKVLKEHNYQSEI